MIYFVLIFFSIYWLIEVIFNKATRLASSFQMLSFWELKLYLYFLYETHHIYFKKFINQYKDFKWGVYIFTYEAWCTYSDLHWMNFVLWSLSVAGYITMRNFVEMHSGVKKLCKCHFIENKFLNKIINLKTRLCLKRLSYWKIITALYFTQWTTPNIMVCM